jgi:serine protease
MKMTRLLFLLFLIQFQFATSAVDNRIDREVLVQVTAENSNFNYVQALFPNEKISLTAASFQIWKVEFQPKIDLIRLYELIRQGKIIQLIRNRKLDARGTSPNDPLFIKQPYLFNKIDLGKTIPFGISAEDAWDYNKSAVTARGDTIVVAVCDFGFDTAHEDLDYFINKKEIPYDGIDNDSNGAKDDYRGWNVGDNNAILAGTRTQHGMTVCGRIAAKGNNGKGVTGVAWNCKLLPLNNIATIEFSIKSFEYIINMKRLYHNSNKQKGAYIVAVNYSLGTSGFLPVDEPLWCAIFDSLGKVGILSSCAVDNKQQDVESYQDMPILCNSPYMINVTACDSANIGLTGSAFSTKYVHLAAPNTNYSTLMNNSYGLQPAGASFSAPLVAGTIALMYSNFDTKLLDTLHKNPNLVLKKIKEVIIKQVDVSTNLTGKLVSNGKLNLFKTIKTARTLQDSFYPRANASITDKSYLNDILYSYDKKIAIKKSNHIPLFLSIYNMMGQEVMKKIIFENEAILDGEKLPDGIYIATYQLDNQFYSKKIDLR